MSDQWDEELSCPLCKKSGLASLSQFDDAAMPVVGGVSDGFRAVQTEYGPDFYCGTCGIRTLP
jgi:hypothetical protein